MRPTPRLLVALLFAAPLLPACGRGGPSGPNVLLITIDTLRADRLGCYGYERPTTPEIDAFAATAVRFEECHSSSSWTLPGLATLMTGHYAAAHLCTQPLSRLDPSHVTLAEELRDAGWDTAMVGCHLFQDERFGLQQGYVHVDDELIRTSTESDQTITSPGVTERGLRFLEHKAEAPDGAPWLLWLHYFDPHDAYLVHEGFSEPFGVVEESDRYDGEIRFTDHHVGRVLRRLTELGLERDTLVVLTSDHGEEFGDHGQKRHGYNLYRETVRVPLLVREPGGAPGVVEEVCSLADVWATVLDLCGVRPRTLAQGVPLTAALSGGAEPDVPALSEVSWHAGQDMRSLRRGRWTYYEHRFRGEEADRLYDRSSDPTEQHDVAARHPDVLASLRAELERERQRARDLGAAYASRDGGSVAAGDLERLRALGYVGEDPDVVGSATGEGATGEGGDGGEGDAEEPR